MIQARIRGPQRHNNGQKASTSTVAMFASAFQVALFVVVEVELRLANPRRGDFDIQFSRGFEVKKYFLHRPRDPPPQKKGRLKSGIRGPTGTGKRQHVTATGCNRRKYKAIFYPKY